MSSAESSKEILGGLYSRTTEEISRILLMGIHAGMNEKVYQEIFVETLGKNPCRIEKRINENPH